MKVYRHSPASWVAKTVDGYVAELEDWRGEAIMTLRQIVRAAAPKAQETIKWAQQV
jgi:hypothetical protein